MQFMKYTHHDFTPYGIVEIKTGKVIKLSRFKHRVRINKLVWQLNTAKVTPRYAAMVLPCDIRRKIG